MSGRTDVVLDTNSALASLRGDASVGRIVRANPDVNTHVSVITRMEMLAFGGLVPEEEAAIRRFLDDVAVIPLNAEVERIAIAVRRDTRRKLPDAIVAACAVWLGAPLVTGDKQLAKTVYPGLETTLVPLEPPQ